ncbi:hypothetical protein [Deinococcus humi]|uniref:Uncharacterized protein n=1 Tax=Deinococcus humi TaxID=662880 RepID=A0A7W8NEU2_9DEIO|nr:hypothetical protein [Deinococcus humi]MBB5362113.1 hypothetical protein [Deinococcus humi]GGO22003.1 hypothetical protein GCM10008949_08840 [Deinococcus humi]
MKKSLKRLVALALLSLSLASAASTPANIADELALVTRAVRLSCPVQVSAGSECSMADMSIDIVRRLIDIDPRKMLTKPWRQLVGGSVQTFVEQDGQLIGIALFALAPFKTLIVVSPAATLPAANTAPSTGTNSVASFDLRMLVWTNSGKVIRQGQSAPVNGPLIPLVSLVAVGCDVKPETGNMVRVTCEYPYVGKVYDIVKLR